MMSMTKDKPVRLDRKDTAASADAENARDRRETVFIEEDDKESDSIDFLPTIGTRSKGQKDRCITSFAHLGLKSPSRRLY